MSKNETGIIYLIQPAQCVDTEHFKIGMSNNNDLKRCNSYLNGSRYLCIFECKNPLNLEKIIKNEFTKNFKLIAGKEYFKGDEKKIKQLFIELFSQYDNIKLNTKSDAGLDIKSYTKSDEELSTDSEDDSDKEPYEESDKEYKIYKKNNVNDIVNKKKLLIYISIESFKTDLMDSPISYNVTIYYPYYLIGFQNISINSIKINDNLGSTDNYKLWFKKIIENKIIENDKYYNLYDKSFINKIIKSKLKLTIEKIDNFIYNKLQNEDNEKIENIIMNLFWHECIVNKNIHCMKENSILYPYFEYNDNVYIHIVKINNKLYTWQYLRDYIPYRIDYDNKNYSMLNRKNNIINIDQSLNSEYRNKNKFTKSIYLFNDGSTCWGEGLDNKINSNNFKKIKEKFYEITNNLNCLNKCQETNYIFENI